MFFFSSRRRHTRCALVTGFRRVLFRSPAVTWSGLAEPSTAPARLPPLLVLSGIQKRPRHEAAAFVTLRHYHLADTWRIAWSLEQAKREGDPAHADNRPSRIRPIRSLDVGASRHIETDSDIGQRSEEHTSELQSLMRTS